MSGFCLLAPLEVINCPPPGLYIRRVRSKYSFPLVCSPCVILSTLPLEQNRILGYTDLGLLVDLRGAWLDSSFWDWFWHSRVSKFRGREHYLVVAVAEWALHRLHYVSGSLEVPGTLLDCFSLTTDVLVCLGTGSPALLAQHPPTFPTCSVTLSMSLPALLAPPLPPWWIPGRAFQSVCHLCCQPLMQ